MAGKVRLGTARRSMDRMSKAGESRKRRGGAVSGEASFGTAGMDGIGVDRKEQNRRGRHGMDETGE